MVPNKINSFFYKNVMKNFMLKLQKNSKFNWINEFWNWSNIHEYFYIKIYTEYL
jgi:hypothetical protein